MQGVSFGLANLSYRLGQAQEAQGSRSHRHHHSDVASTSSTTTSRLSRVSGSVLDLRNQLDALGTSSTLPAGFGAGDGVTGTGAQLINKQRGVLQIQTQEGDLVTLRFKSKVSVTVDDQQLKAGDTSVSSTSAELRGYSRVSVSVDGNLNADELKAIDDLVGKVGDLTDEFFNGDLNKVLSRAMNLSYDSSQLADYSLDLRLKQSVRAYTYAVPLLPPPPQAASTSSALPSPTPIEVITPATEPVPSPAATEVVSADASPAPASTPEVPQVVDTPVVAAPVTDTAAPPSNADTTSNAKQIVADYVAKVRASFTVSAGDVSLGVSYEFKVRLLLSSISQSAPVEATPSNDSLAKLEQQLTSSAA